MRGRNFVQRGIFLAMLVISLFTVGCQPKDTVLVGQADEGGKVSLAAGQTLVVQLQSNPTTGYSWAVEECDAVVLAAQGEPEYTPDASFSIEQRSGSGGVEVFRFTAAEAGQTHLKLIYRRPWEEGVEPVDVFEVDVTVQ